MQKLGTERRMRIKHKEERRRTLAKKIGSLLEPHSTDQPQNERGSQEQGKVCSGRLEAERGEQVYLAL